MFNLRPPSAPAFVRGSPVDYFDRRVRLRLFLGLAVILLLAGVLERSWNREQRRPGQVATAPAVERIDNRLNGPAWRTASDPAGTFVAQSDAKSVAPAAAFDPSERAWTKGWQDVLARLSAEERNLLFEILHAATDRHALPAARQAAATDLLDKIKRHWDAYQAAAFQSVADLPADDQSRWADVLRQVNTQFSDAQSAWLSFIAGSDAAVASGPALDRLRTTLVALARAEIQDDTVVFRPAEQDIWFHDLARAQDRQAQDSPVVNHVAYLQLYKQPAEYRGQFVTVNGTVRLAYRVPASQNYLGVKDYYVYWIHPAGGPDSPILVYALSAPPGFPAVTDRAGSADQSARQLREDVEVTGIFFKRAAYAAQGGTYTAPLVIASEPKWHRAPASELPARPPLRPRDLAAAVTVALVLAACLATMVWRRSRRITSSRNASAVVALGPLTIGPTAEERFRALEHQARSEETA